MKTGVIYLVTAASLCFIGLDVVGIVVGAAAVYFDHVQVK